jgi:hypothetical protein
LIPDSPCPLLVATSPSTFSSSFDLSDWNIIPLRSPPDVPIKRVALQQRSASRPHKKTDFYWQIMGTWNSQLARRRILWCSIQSPT